MIKLARWLFCTPYFGVVSSGECEDREKERENGTGNSAGRQKARRRMRSTGPDSVHQSLLRGPVPEQKVGEINEDRDRERDRKTQRIMQTT